MRTGRGEVKVKATLACKEVGFAMPRTLTITDSSSNAKLEVPVEDGAFHATAFRELGLMSYDPAFLNTASVRSAITFIDGDDGILRYRGYPIEQLAVDSTYLETAF